MSTIGKNAAFSLLHRVGEVVFPLISGMYLARVLGPEHLGQVAAVRNTVSYFLLLSALGIPRYALREAARCRENKQQLETFVSEILVLHLGAGLIALAAFWLLFCLEPVNWLHRIFALELLFQLCNVEWLLEGREEYRFIALRGLAVRILSFLALVLFVRGPEDVPAYAVILCLATGGNHLLNLSRAGVRLTCRDLQPRRHLKPVLTLMVSGLAASLYSKVDISMLNLLGDAAAVGFYTTGYKVILMVLTAATALSAVYVPRLSRSTGEAFQTCLSEALSMLLAVTIPAAVGLWLVAEDLTLVLFGQGFLPAAKVLRILSPLVLIRGCGDLLCYQAIICAGKEKWLIGARIWAGFANICLNGLLIPIFGFAGAAFASLVSEGVVNGILLAKSRKIAVPNVSGKRLLRIGSGTAVMAAAVLTVQSAASSPMLSLTFSVGLGAGMYAIILGYRNTKIGRKKDHGTEK